MNKRDNLAPLDSLEDTHLVTFLNSAYPFPYITRHCEALNL